MKINTSIHNLFKKLEDEDVQMETIQNREGDINIKKIKQETKERVQKENRDNTFKYSKKLSKVAMVAVVILCIGSVTTYAFASEEVKSIITEMLGISETEVLTIGESVQNKDYKLTVIDIASDTNTGWVTVSVEAKSDEAKANFKNENIIKKFEHIGDVGYGIRELEELEKESIRYVSFEFNDANKQQDKCELKFSIEGIRDCIKVEIPQTTTLEKVDIAVEATKEQEITFYEMEYSELGFTLYGKLLEVTEKDANIDISFEFFDGSVNEFYHSTTSNDVEFSEEWFSGCGAHLDGEGNYVGIYTFSKKMDWSSVKAIRINGTEILIKQV